MSWKTWVFTIAAASAGFTLGACRADDVVKHGIEGEYCNDRDEDCRDGLICDQGVCRGGGADTATCGEVCNHLEACETGEENCEANCRATLDGTCDDGLPCPWSSEAAETFGECILDLSCEDARASDATQRCYRELPIDEERQNRCDAFIAAAERCDEDAEVGALRNRCFLLGRTNTDDSFARTDACVDRIGDGLCAEIEDCFNSVFELEPLIELGDDQLDGGRMQTNNVPG